MAVYFHCSACRERHRSRLRSSDPSWLAVYIAAVGPVLEQCDHTHTWVSVAVGDLSVEEPPEGSGSGHWWAVAGPAELVADVPRGA